MVKVENIGGINYIVVGKEDLSCDSRFYIIENGPNVEIVPFKLINAQVVTLRKMAKMLGISANKKCDLLAALYLRIIYDAEIAQGCCTA